MRSRGIIPLTDQVVISQIVVCKEYMRLVFRRVHPELESFQYQDEIPKSEIDLVKADGLALASDLYFKLPIQQYLRDLDGFSDDHLAPAVDAKYPAP
jgi:hypothetical protein